MRDSADAAPRPSLYRIPACHRRGRRRRGEALLSAGRLRNLGATNVISPKSDLAVVSETTAGDEGTFIVRATVAGNVSTGRVDFVRERGAWKIFSESSDIGAAPAPVQTERHPAAVDKLMEHRYARPSADFFVMAAGTGDLETVKLFLEAGYDVNTKSGGTPVIVSAATSNGPDVVIYLIKAGADVIASTTSTAPLSCTPPRNAACPRPCARC
jgi:hypothetical protein